MSNEKTVMLVNLACLLGYEADISVEERELGHDAIIRIPFHDKENAVGTIQDLLADNEIVEEVDTDER